MPTSVWIQIALLLAVLAIVVLWSIARRMRMAANAKAFAEQAEMLKALRLHALQEVPEDLDEAIGPDQPYTVLMEIGVPNGAATILGSAAGDASIYTTSGAALLGGIGHENVRRAAIAFVHEANNHRDSVKPSSDYSYPTDGNVRFYVRTRSGLYATADRSEDSLGNKADPLWPLFYAGQEVIKEFRTVAPDFGR